MQQSEEQLMEKVSRPWMVMSEAAVWASVHVAHPMRCDVYQTNVPKTIICVICCGRLHVAGHAVVLPTEWLYPV